MPIRVLVIRSKPLKYFVQSIPAFAAIRKFHKDDEISILTEKSLIRFCKKTGFFDKVWLDSQPEWLDVMGVYDIITRLRNGKFDMVYDLDNTKRSEWYFRLIGFNKPMWSSSIIDWCSHPYKLKQNEPLHYQETIQNQLKVANIKNIPDINISYMRKKHNFDDLPEKFAMVCAAGDKDKKAHKWDPILYAEMIDFLERQYDLRSVLVGDNEDDYWVNNYIIDKCMNSKPINYSGKTTIRGLINVAEKARFCIGNDTAPTHIAAYTGKKTIMICSRFSPPELIAPRVRNLAIIDEPFLENVSLDRVLLTVRDFVVNAPKHEETYKIVEQEPFASKEAEFEK